MTAGKFMKVIGVKHQADESTLIAISTNELDVRKARKAIRALAPFAHRVSTVEINVPDQLASFCAVFKAGIPFPKVRVGDIR